MGAVHEAGRQDPPRAVGASMWAGILDNPAAPFVIGLVATVAVYRTVLPLFPQAEAWQGLRAKLAERGWTPMVCMFLFLSHFAHLVLRYFLRMLPESRLLREAPLPAGASQLAAQDLEAIWQRSCRITESTGATRFPDRILAGIQAYNNKHDLGEMSVVLQACDQEDRARATRTYKFLKAILLVMPVLGFLGTNIGISLAIGSMHKGLNAAAETEGALSNALSNVSYMMSIAFDTTSVAFFMSALAWVLQSLLQRREMKLLDAVQDVLRTRLVSRIRPSAEHGG